MIKLNLELNPVFRRESRVRWRGKRAFTLLFLLAFLFSGVMAFAYYSSDMGEQAIDASAELTRGGREVFRVLSLLQLAAWLLIVPALAAPGVAFERERGLLEGLQLSGMAPWRVALGKFCGVMLFALLLLSVGAPPLALCFLLGGVATEEFLSVFALQITTIISGAALGLYYSTRARRPQQALLNTFVVIVLFLLVTSMGPQLLRNLLSFLEATGLPLREMLDVDGTLLSALQEIQAYNPFTLFHSIFAFDPANMGAMNRALADLKMPLGVALGMSCLLLVLAMQQAGRVLPDAQWVQRRRYLTVRGKRLRWAPVENSVFSTGAPGEEGAQEAPRPVWDVPLASYLRFANPVLQREVRGLLRLRRFSPLITFGLWVVAGLGLVGYAWALMWMLGFPEARGDTWQIVSSLVMIIILLGAPLRGANTIARERENGTWENVRLSLLQPRSVVWGKALAPLVLLSGALLVTAPLWMLSALAPLFAPSTGRGALTPGLILGTLALLFSTTFLLTAWGLWVSWHCRSSSAAMGWAIGSLLVVFCALQIFIVPLAWLISFVYGVGGRFWWIISGGAFYYVLGVPYNSDPQFSLHPFSYPMQELRSLLNPWDILQTLLRHQSGSYYYHSYSYYGDLIPEWARPYLASALYVGLGWLLLRHLEKRLKQTTILEQETLSLQNWLKKWLPSPDVNHSTDAER